MTKIQRRMNLQYCLVHAFYWSGWCSSFTFAAFFLQSRGYSNSSLGLILASGYILGFIFSQFMASLIDSSRKISLFHCLWALLLVQMLLTASFIFLPHGFTLSLLFCLNLCLTLTVSPLNTQMSFQLEKVCDHINFGVARGTGSLMFSVVAVILGRLTASLGGDIIPYVALAVLAAQLIMLFIISHDYKRAPAKEDEKSSDTQTTGSSMLTFIRENRRFCIMLLGVAMLYFAHNLSGNFLINIVRNVGGDSEEMGNLNAFFAVMEIPALFAYDRIVRRFKCSSTLRFSAVFFSIKALGTALAGSMLSLYAIHSLQLLAFGILTPAIVRYVNQHVPVTDSAKGQALAYGMSALGSVFATGIGGIMFDHFSVTFTMLCAAAVCFVGTVTVFIFSEKS